MPSGSIIQVCGNGTTPSATCTTSSVTTLSAGYWYRINKNYTSVSVTYTANGTLYAITRSMGTFSGQMSYSIINIDRTAPTINSVVAQNECRGTIETKTIQDTALSIIIRDNYNLKTVELLNSSNSVVSNINVSGTYYNNSVFCMDVPSCGNYKIRVYDEANNYIISSPVYVCY